MLDIDKSTVDFLVTENMVQEVEKVLSHDVPLVHAIVEEMVKRDIDRIYFVACGSPLNAAQTAGNDSNLLIVFYVQIMPDDFVMQLHRF